MLIWIGGNQRQYRDDITLAVFKCHGMKKEGPLEEVIPICWPWFGEHPTDNSFCSHGFARVIPWELVESSDLKNGATKIVLKMIPTETVKKQLTYNFELILSVVVGETLSLNLKTTNLSDSPFTISEGFHTYFFVSDIENVKGFRVLKMPYLLIRINNFRKGIES